MKLEVELTKLRKLQQSTDKAKEKLLCQVDEVVKKHCNIPYRVDFNSNNLVIRFKTNRLEDLNMPLNIDNELGCDGALVSRQGYYGFHLIYFGDSDD